MSSSPIGLISPFQIDFCDIQNTPQYLGVDDPANSIDCWAIAIIYLRRLRNYLSLTLM